MRLDRYLLPALLLLVAGSLCGPARAQLGFDLKIDKPEPYTERVLRAEKTGDRKLPAQKKFFQNLTTHYNYYFNASNKLNDVIDGAKQGFQEDYTTLLPFYNYSLDVTAQNATQLDSVIYKAQTGIVMHDLRNDWADNMYLLWGAAWFLEKKFDSAALMFQFINYAFAEKEKDGYYRYIGSRMDGNNALTISTKEDHKFPKNLVTPPSRNNAFIWLARTFIELGDLAGAGSLIATLRNDPLFPSRLRNDLEEVQAYWYYRQNVWDSSATHLVQALDLARTKGERARWEYLAAQMFERAGKLSDAEKWYAKSIGHTTDPVMDVYARLNLVRINKSGGEHYIDNNIAELLKMARRDKYADYRDVIYFMAAQMEMERKNFIGAQQLLLKSAKFNSNNPASRNKSFLMVADLSYDQKKYIQAAAFYDSVQTRDLDGPVLQRLEARKAALAKVVGLSETIRREDSLQRIAALPEEERTVYITRLVKQLRRQQGLNDEAGAAPTSGSSLPANTAPTDLFPGSQPRGEWYFYNNTLKTQGLAQFRQVWGTRPNVDNWRRFSDVNQQLLTRVPTNTRNADQQAGNNLPIDNTPSFASLNANLPLSADALRASNDSVRLAMFALANTYATDLEDYPSAIETLEALRTRFPAAPNMNEVLFNLYYAYHKAGDEAKAEAIKKLLLQQFPTSRFATILATGRDPVSPDTKDPQATKAYESIYDLFLSGKFEEAERAKKAADSIYRTSYWQPQLLYIEAVYQIRQRNDSVARNTLQTLIGQNPNSPLAAKAQNLMNVLSRRRQIEDELTRLQIERPREDSASNTAPAAGAPVVQRPPVQGPIRRDTTATNTQKPGTAANLPNTLPRTNADTAAQKPVTTPPKPAAVYRFDSTQQHFAVIVLDKVDALFVTEVKNAFTRYNRDRYYGQEHPVEVRDFDADRKLVLVGGFKNAREATDYLLQAKRMAPSEIMPWLKSDKYSFTLVSPPNLDILLEKKDLIQYRQFLDQNLPGKF